MAIKRVTKARITGVLSVEIHPPDPGTDRVSVTLEVILQATMIVPITCRIASEDVMIPTERLIGLTVVQAEALINGL